MQNENDITREKCIKTVSIIGVIANVFLLGIKGVIGFISGSQAMIADSLNSAGDIFASFMSYVGAKLALKPKDKNHPYGHGKAEYIFSFIISISMIIASIFMIKTSIESIVQKKAVIFSYTLLVICVVTIFTKVILYIYTKNKYKETNSILVKASMEDHRNDIFVTVGTLIGVISSYFGIYIVDSIIGIIISFWIIYVGINLLRDSYIVLMDTSLDEKAYEEIIKLVESDENILHVDDVLSKPVGNKYIIILKISMDGDMKLEKAHNIGGKIKEDLINKYDYITDVITHINPHTI